MPFLKLEVVFTPSDEVVSLREQVKQLEGERDNLQREYNRVEFMYRCECVVNLELQDLLKEHGISYRKVLKQFGGKETRPGS